MASFGESFNANEHESMGEFSPVPAGQYVAVITESEWKPTKKNDGQYLQMKVEIIDGEFKGRTLFVRLNLQNPSAQAMTIAKSELATICKAVGVITPTDSSELHNKPMEIKVTVKPAEGNYQASNEIKNYAAIGTASPAATQTAPASSAKKPWEK